MRQIYLLSGLGADKRVFEFIDFKGLTVTHIDWIKPLGNETLEHYAKRLREKITSTRPTLIGVSFGGILAVEISKQIETEKVILISSASTNTGVPFFFRLLGKMKLHKLVPTSLLTNTNPINSWMFGAETGQEKILLKEMIKATDPVFLRWAIDKILTWKNRSVPKEVVHIHGSADHLLPLRKSDFVIKRGGHLMVLNRGKEISDLIHQILR